MGGWSQLIWDAGQGVVIPEKVPEADRNGVARG